MENKAINPQYFKPKDTKGQSIQWTELEDTLLKSAIQKFGIGEWNLIRSEFLKNWDTTTLKVRTMKMLATQNLDELKGWKGDSTKIEELRSKNIQGAKESGTFKYGVELSKKHGDLLNFV